MALIFYTLIGILFIAVLAVIGLISYLFWNILTYAGIGVLVLGIIIFIIQDITNNK